MSDPTSSPNIDKKLWGGRFAQSTDPLLDAINASIQFDHQLWRQDIAGSRAWATELGEAGVLTPDEVEQIHKGLQGISERIAAGDFVFEVAHEDIHMNIEAALTQEIGDTGGKLHTGRSRNDQVATDVRLYVRDRIDDLFAVFDELTELLLTLAELHAADPMPGYTHLQRAQPITLGYHLLCWTTGLIEDRERFSFARRMANRLPLGSAALAGTAYPVDRTRLADSLGFDKAIPNGMHAVSDRGFVLDCLHACVTTALHLSRLGEELVLWNSQEFGLIQLDDAWATGSSIMPQKKNPDGAELLRAKPARVSAAYQTLVMIQKGLPNAYNKDLQEDKEPLFDALDTVELALRVALGMLAHIRFAKEKMAASVDQGHLLATELADYLAGRGVAFRTAHKIVGQAVSLATERDCRLQDLPLEIYESLHERFDASLYDVLEVDRALDKRDVLGGTAPARVREAIVLLRNELENQP